jgi:hypothetical protein
MTVSSIASRARISYLPSTLIQKLRWYSAHVNAPQAQHESSLFSIVLPEMPGYTATWGTNPIFEGVMRQAHLSIWLVLIVAAVCSIGCKTDGSWDEVWKDLKGDNMQMRSGNLAASKSLEQPKAQP